MFTSKDPLPDFNMVPPDAPKDPLTDAEVLDEVEGSFDSPSVMGWIRSAAKACRLECAVREADEQRDYTCLWREVVELLCDMQLPVEQYKHAQKKRLLAQSNDDDYTKHLRASIVQIEDNIAEINRIRNERRG